MRSNVFSVLDDAELCALYHREGSARKMWRRGLLFPFAEIRAEMVRRCLMGPGKKADDTWREMWSRRLAGMV